MTNTIPRHAVNSVNYPNFAEAIKEDLSEDIRQLAAAPGSFNSTLIDSLTFCQIRGALDPSGEDLNTWRAYTTGMEIGSALFATVQTPGSAVECQIEGATYTFSVKGAQQAASAGNWLTALWLTMVCRERGRSEMLAETPIDLIRRSGLEYDDYIYSWIETLQAYWSGRPGLVDSLTRTIELSYPETASIAGRELMNHVLYHPINLFHKYIRGDHDGFNQALADALQMHMTYWTANDDRSNSPQGLIALGPLAISCLAHDAGFPIAVKSDYIPEGLIEGVWYGRQ